MCKIKILIFIYLTVTSSCLEDSDEATVSVDEGDYATSWECRGYCGENIYRSGRLYDPPMKSRVIDAMMKSQILPLTKDKPDLFSSFTDKYDLPKGFTGPLAEYDFIIVGAGSAGSVLAARLSQGGKASVLLLEAGQGESILTDVPILAPLLQQTGYVWPYVMEYEPNVCTGMVEGKCFWPRGKAVGGTSVVNYMIYTRGLEEDWNRIAAAGNYGWSYNEVTQYYIKHEHANLKGLQNSPWHGRDGELSVEDIPFRSKLSKAFLDAAKLYGHRRVDYKV